ncbi:MAG: AgmX/PglI C-terminal domain-containing protein, partial [Myxococcales bacterium]|nr:AgmX/PglI C-terminal domain-containing protein [Myxococcales bacterium]
PSAAPKTEAATGALAALDRGRVEAPVEKVEAPAEVEELPDTLEQRTISGVIKTNKRGVEGCYQRQLKRDPTMRQASIKLRFNIERTGQTSNVVLDEKYKGTELAACLERLVRRWRFPAFKGEAIPVEYPVLFHTSL